MRTGGSSASHLQPANASCTWSGDCPPQPYEPKAMLFFLFPVSPLK